jgi:F-type H+-transporting ATPase subunit b
MYSQLSQVAWLAAVCTVLLSYCLLSIMDQMLSQLGGLVLGSVPTMVLFLLLVVAYGYLVRRPLDRVLTERRARTTGAVEQARGAIAQAEAKTADYEDRLRKAKAEVFQTRDKRLKQWAVERDQALGEVRSLTTAKVQAAKVEIEHSVVLAQRQIEGMSAELSEQILRAVLPAGSRPEAVQ